VCLLRVKNQTNRPTNISKQYTRAHEKKKKKTALLSIESWLAGCLMGILLMVYWLVLIPHFVAHLLVIRVNGHPLLADSSSRFAQPSVLQSKSVKQSINSNKKNIKTIRPCYQLTPYTTNPNCPGFMSVEAG